MMRLQIQSLVASQNRITFPIRKTIRSPNGRGPLWGIFILVVVAFIGFSAKPFLERGLTGELQLAKWRKDKLDRELKNLDEAEQYALLALRGGIYPCYSCPSSTTITLKTGEVWKYGFTTKSEKGRYQKSLESKNLLYIVEYEGTITACMKEEKRKIYFYALQPENLARTVPLIRPPGNKQDN